MYFKQENTKRNTFKIQNADQIVTKLTIWVPIFCRLFLSQYILMSLSSSQAAAFLLSFIPGEDCFCCLQNFSQSTAQQLIGAIHPQCPGFTWINPPLSFFLCRCPGLPSQEGWGWWSDLLWCLSLPPGLWSPLFLQYQTYRARAGALRMRLSQTNSHFTELLLFWSFGGLFRSVVEQVEKKLMCYGLSDTFSCIFHSQGTKVIPQVKKLLLINHQR